MSLRKYAELREGKGGSFRDERNALCDAASIREISFPPRKKGNTEKEKVFLKFRSIWRIEREERLERWMKIWSLSLGKKASFFWLLSKTKENSQKPLRVARVMCLDRCAYVSQQRAITRSKLTEKAH